MVFLSSQRLPPLKTQYSPLGPQNHLRSLDSARDLVVGRHLITCNNFGETLFHMADFSHRTGLISRRHSLGLWVRMFSLDSVSSDRFADPALVFGEIMGVIKGSEEAVGMKERCLDRETYRSLSSRTQGTFAHKRDEIYNLFMAYTNLKVRRQDYDAADR